MITELSKQLWFSRPEHSKARTAEAFGVSIVLHLAVILAAAYLTIAPPRTIEPDQPHLLMPILQEERSLPDEPVPPPPPAPPDRPPAQSVTDAPRGFQRLTVPTYISPEIPPPTVGPEIDEADFSGVGVEGGRGRGEAPDTARIVTTDDVSAAPAFTPYTVAPKLQNRQEIATLLQKNYPVLLRDAGIGGRVIMWLFIDESGVVKKTQVKESSGLEPLDSAAVVVSRQMRFSPALNRDTEVPVWVAIPITFKVESL